MANKEYNDIPGTFVFDADRSREGYHLNQFCISLRLQKNRDAFNNDEKSYLDKYPMTDAQRDAVINRSWNLLLELGGNIYYTWFRYECLNFQIFGMVKMARNATSILDGIGVLRC